MIDTNYSRNVTLLDEEIYDYDTKDAHETGINKDRMRLPTRYDISKYYKRSSKPSSYDKLGNPRYEKGTWTKKKPSEMLDFSEDFDWQITYRFPDTIRDNTVHSTGLEYGGANVTFRRLYLILCEHFNNGVYFIDTYFNEVYPYTVKDMVDDSLSDLKLDLLSYAEGALESAEEENQAEGLEGFKITKRGTLSRAARVRNRSAFEALDAYEKYAKEWESSYGTYLADIIKEDIINSLMTGQISLAYDNSPATESKRLAVGLSKTPKFFATAQLIESIELFVKIRGKGTWQTKQGIMV